MNDELEVTAIESDSDRTPTDLSETPDSVKASNDLKSKKFIAYIVSVIVSLAGFLTVYFTAKDISSYEKFLNFMLWSLVAYIGGNSAERLTDKLGK